jgi:hypothetical protein
MNNITLADIFFALCNTKFNSQRFYVLYVSHNSPLSLHTSANWLASVIVTRDRDDVLAACTSWIFKYNSVSSQCTWDWWEHKVQSVGSFSAHFGFPLSVCFRQISNSSVTFRMRTNFQQSVIFRKSTSTVERRGMAVVRGTSVCLSEVGVNVKM